VRGAGGFLASEIRVLSGPAAAERLGAKTGRSGLAGLAIRIAEKLGIEDNEMERKSSYESALREGGFVVAVAAPTDERKELAAALLRDAGAHTVNYFGRFTIEGMVPPKQG
jgi:hypothetical protein